MALVSIITITYNAEKFLERTVLSVKNQTSDDYEYLLIDGGSKDGTLEIANKYEDVFDLIVSEKDKGLYDAMNKGLKLAKGEYVWFMNAGDEIAENLAIENIQKIGDADVIFSDTLMVDEIGKVLGPRTEITPHKIPENLTWNGYKTGMLVCHQSFIVKREIAPQYIENNLSADIDWEIKCLKNAKVIKAYPGILAKYLEGGTSHKQIFKSWKDRFWVLNAHFGFLQNILNHLHIIFRADWKNTFRVLKYIKN